MALYCGVNPKAKAQVPGGPMPLARLQVPSVSKPPGVLGMTASDTSE
jgi:hypothetical protein